MLRTPQPGLFALATLVALTACSLDEPVNPWTKSSSGGAASSSTTAGSPSTSASSTSSASSSGSSMGTASDCASNTLSPCILADGIDGLTGLATDGLTAYATQAGSNKPSALLELSAVARSTPVVVPTAAAPSSPLLSEGMVYWKTRGTGAFDGGIWRIEPGNVPRMVTGMLNDGPFTVDGSQVVWAANYTAWELYGCAASNCSPSSLGSLPSEPTQVQSIGDQLIWTSSGSLFHCTSGQCQGGAFSGLPSPTVSALVIANGAPVVALDEGLFRCELASGACKLLYPAALVLHRKVATNGSEIFFTDDQAISHVSSNGTDLGSVSFQWSPKVVGLQVVGAFVYLADAGSGTVWRAAW